MCETRAAPDGQAEGLPGGRVGAQGWGLPLPFCQLSGGQGAAEVVPSLGWLTVHQQGPEQSQAVDTDVPVPGEAVQAPQDVLKQPGPLQLICGQSCGWALARGHREPLLKRGFPSLLTSRLLISAVTQLSH